jgi:uncharacterized protein (DUF885 family)
MKPVLTNLTIIFLASWLTACNNSPINSTNSSINSKIPSSPSATSTSAQSTTLSADEQFEKLLDEHWSWNASQYPSFATSLGIRDYDDKLSDPSLDAYEARIAYQKTLLTQFQAIDLVALSEANQLNHALMVLNLGYDIEAANYGGKYMLITNRGGPHMSLTGLPSRLPFFTKADYESYVTRLNVMPDTLEKATNTLRSGLVAGWVQPCAPMIGYESSISSHIVEPSESVFMQPFVKKPAAMDQDDFDALKATALKTIKKQIIPAFKTFQTFYNSEYAPQCRAQVGTSSLPGGAEYYAYRTRMFTTTEMTPEQVHKTGLSEVSRIRAEMQEVKQQAGFEGTFAQWLVFLRTDEQFYFKTGQERLDAAAVIGKKIDGALPQLFTKFPRMPWGLKEIPLDIAEKTTTAYYQRPAGDGSRAGFYFVNTTKLDTRPSYELEALSLHEAVPGHHFQIALSQELDLPDFRKFGGFTAFIEGWGLYSERLGLEVGFYQTPYSNMGRLSYEMWRACRLVVDTGMHAKGWTRQQSIDFMTENSALSLNNITTEVDRYITWPGQALAYKIGELKIRELRSLAEAELGNAFDVRYFHDKVLENGAVPLSVLENIVKVWITEEKAKG